MSFGPPTGKYVKTKRPVLRSQLDDDAEDALVSARARAIARGEGAMRKDRRERRLAAMTNEPNVMREVRAHPANHPPLRARARAPSWFLSVDASSRRRVRRTARSRFQIRRRPGAGPRPDPPLPTPASHPAPPSPRAEHPPHQGGQVRQLRPPRRRPPREIQRPAVRRARRSTPPAARPTLVRRAVRRRHPPPTHRHPRHPKAPTVLVLRGAHRRVVPLALLPSRFRTRGGAPRE